MSSCSGRSCQNSRGKRRNSRAISNQKRTSKRRARKLAAKVSSARSKTPPTQSCASTKKKQPQWSAAVPAAVRCAPRSPRRGRGFLQETRHDAGVASSYHALEYPLVALPARTQRLQDALDLILAAGFQGNVDQRISQVDAVVGAIKLKLDDVRMMSGDDLRELMER